MAEELYQLPRQVSERRRRLFLYLMFLLAGSALAGLEATGWWFGRAFGHPPELGSLASWPSRAIWMGMGSLSFVGLGLGELGEEKRAQGLAFALAGLWWTWGAAGQVYSPVVLLLAMHRLVQLGEWQREIREAIGFGGGLAAAYSGCAAWCLKAAWRRLPGPGDAYGSARFARRDEVRKREDLKVGGTLGEGIVLGAVNGGYLRFQGDAHVLAFAPPGGGKTTCVVVPTALAHPGPLIVLDAKREIYQLTSGFRRRAHGSRVLCWAPSGGAGFSRHNPMLEIRDHPYDVRDAQRIAGALIASVPTNADPFWREAPRQILVGALLHGKYCREWGSLPKVYQLFTIGGQKAIEAMARAPHDPELRFEWLDPKGRPTATHPAVAAAAQNVLEMSAQTRSSVLATVSAALSIYADPVLAESVSASDFSLRELTREGERPISLYLCFEPDERDRLGPHLRVVISQLAGAILERDASKRWEWQGRILLLDEFPVLGAIREIEQGLAYFRGYGASFLVVVQYLGQLIQAFGREEAVSPNCAVQVAFAPTDLATAERLSNLSGKQTIEIDQVSRSSGGLGSGRGGISRQTVLQGRSLLDASEFRRLGREQAVVFIPGLAPLVVKKKPYFDDPESFEPPGKSPGMSLRDRSSRTARRPEEAPDRRRESPHGSRTRTGACDEGGLAQVAERAGSASMAEAEYAAAMGRFLGRQVCELFADERIVEIYVNADLVVRTDGVEGRRETDLALSEESVRGFLNIAATREGISLGGEASACEIAAELPAEIFGKARLQGMVPPLVEVATFVVRKHPARILLLPELVSCGSASAEQFAVLQASLVAGESLIVSGATKSGKTNLVNALLHELVLIRPDVRVVILEDTPEVVCPARDTLRMVTVDQRVELHDLVRIGVRCHPDVFVVGEVRGRDAYPFLDSMATGHGGGMCTIHAGSPLGALMRLNRLARLGASGELEQHALIAEVIRLVVQMAWVGSAPRIVEIVRVQGWVEGKGYQLERLA